CPAAGPHRASRRAWESRSRRVRSIASFYTGYTGVARAFGVAGAPGVTGAPLRLELALVQMSQLLERRRLPGLFVVAHARDARKAQRESRAVRGTALDLVVLDLDDDFGPHAHGVAVVGRRQLGQAFGHLDELGVGESLERLADVRERLAVAHREVVVRQPAHAPAGAAVDGDDHAIHRLGRLQLEPALAASAGLVGAGEILRHHAFVPRRERA